MSDDHGSHLRVLKALLRAEHPKKVLEYGAGEHSTTAFLEHPSVELLVSYEIDQKWRDKVRAKHPEERRLEFWYSKKLWPMGFDLIFIDDGKEAEERLETIEWVLSRPHPTVVIHDAQVPEYQQAIGRLTDDFTIFPTDPDTAVIGRCEY